MNAARLVALALSAGLLCGCGYTNKTILPKEISTIAVPTFEDRIPAEVDFTHQAGLPIDVTNAVIDRLLFDGNLRVVDEKEADVTLVGKIVRFDQEPTRFNELERVEEYRLIVTAHVTLLDNRTKRPLWVESSLSGEKVFFLEGSRASGQRLATEEAVLEVARNIVDRIVEDW